MTTTRHQLRISGPAEMVQAVPYLLGFHPADSLVLVGLGDGILQVTARIDLPDVLVGAADPTVASMARGGVTDLVAIVYSEPADPPVVDAVVDELCDAANSHGCAIGEVLVVAGGRWWSLSCADDGCCPAEGRPVPEAPSAFAAASAYEGVVALPDRAALAAVLEPRPHAEREALREVIGQRVGPGRAERRRARAVAHDLVARARASELPGWSPPGDDETAQWGADLSALPVRDAVWTAIERRELDARPLLRHLARSLPDPYDAPALFLFGWSAWRAGDGALARIAAEATVASDPRYSAADVLLAALELGIDPRRMPRMDIPRPA